MRGRIVPLLVAVIGLFLLAFFRWTTPSYDLLTGPIDSHGRQGETVSSTRFTVEVSKVVLADKLAFARYGRQVERSTSGVWAVISAEMASTEETTMINAAAIRGASGRLYTQSTRISGAPGLLRPGSSCRNSRSRVSIPKSW